MELRAPNGGIVEASGEHAERLLAGGFTKVEKPKKPKKKAKKSEE